MNPFTGKMAIEDPTEWVGSKDAYNELKSCIEQRISRHILGVKGSGKTSLLKCVFTPEYKREMAVRSDKKTLICSVELQTIKNWEDICTYLYQQIKHSLRRFLKEKPEEWQEIQSELQSIEEDVTQGQAILQQAIIALHDDFSYFVILVMDNFNEFTLSPFITIEHHEVLRSLINENMLRCIVATDYDLKQDSLPKNVRGSYLLQMFTSPILTAPFSEDDAIHFIKKKQEQSDMKLGEELISVLYKLSGGIPWLLITAAECSYENLKKHNGEMNLDEVKDAIYQACIPYMESWCELLTYPHVEVLTMLASSIMPDKGYAHYNFSYDESILRTAVADLKDRGLLKQVYRTDEFGNVMKGPDFEVSFNSILFQRFCKERVDDQTLEKFAKDNPLTNKENINTESKHKYDLEVSTDISQEPKNQVINNYYGNVFTNGAEDHSQSINAKSIQINNQINQGISPAQLLDMLSQGDVRQLFGEQFSELIRKNVAIEEIPHLIREEGVSDEEYAQQYDQAYEKIGNRIIQDVETDQEEDLVDITPDALQTLEDRFNEARRRCRANVTDEMLTVQSERCQFYIKLSVIVEDALNFPGAFSMSDFSPQLVLYGKALEQALRDNLYELFHKEEKLSVYDTYTRSESRNPNNENVFGNKSMRETYIGNYAYLIKYKKEYLGDLCNANDSCLDAFGLSDTDTWTDWWDKLQEDIHKARHIRNLTDHADEESPDQVNLDSMCELLFGDGNRKGIMDRIRVGKALSARIIPTEITQSVVDQLIGSFCRIRCTQLKSNGGIKGETCDGHYIVNVSPRKVNKYLETVQESNFEPVNQIFNVRIVEFKAQDGYEFFSAEIMERILEQN